MIPTGKQQPDKTPEFPQSNFSTRAQDSFKRGARKRIIWASVGAIVMVLLVVLLAPKYDPRQERVPHRSHGIIIAPVAAQRGNVSVRKTDQPRSFEATLPDGEAVALTIELQ